MNEAQSLTSNNQEVLVLLTMLLSPHYGMKTLKTKAPSSQKCGMRRDT